MIIKFTLPAASTEQLKALQQHFRDHLVRCTVFCADCGKPFVTTVHQDRPETLDQVGPDCCPF